MPQLGETVTEGTITRWLKQVGEPVRKGETVLTLYTDDEARFGRARSALADACDGAGALEFGESAPERTLLLDRIAPN